jgi:hypothetical protein
MRRPVITVTIRNEQGDVLHSEKRAAFNAGIRASEDAVRKIAQAEHTTYEAERPSRVGDVYTRRWTSKNGHVIIATIEKESEATMEARKKRAPENDDRKRGSDYAAEQLAGQYFQDWVWDQMVEAEQMRNEDPNSVLPLENKAHARKIARNMLQQLGWDTKRELKESKEFYEGFDEALKSQASIDWLAEMVLDFNREAREKTAPEARETSQDTVTLAKKIARDSSGSEPHLLQALTTERVLVLRAYPAPAFGLATDGRQNLLQIHVRFPDGTMGYFAPGGPPRLWSYTFTPGTKPGDENLPGVPVSDIASVTVGDHSEMPTHLPTIDMYQDAQVFINGRYQVGFTFTPSRGPEAAAREVLSLTRDGDTIEVKQGQEVWTYKVTGKGSAKRLVTVREAREAYGRRGRYPRRDSDVVEKYKRYEKEWKRLSAEYRAKTDPLKAGLVEIDGQDLRSRGLQVPPRDNEVLIASLNDPRKGNEPVALFYQYPGFGYGESYGFGSKYYVDPAIVPAGKGTREAKHEHRAQRGNANLDTLLSGAKSIVDNRGSWSASFEDVYIWIGDPSANGQYEADVNYGERSYQLSSHSYDALCKQIKKAIDELKSGGGVQESRRGRRPITPYYSKR